MSINNLYFMDLGIIKIFYVDIKICNLVCIRLCVFDDIKIKRIYLLEIYFFRDFCSIMFILNSCIIMLK